MTLTGADLEGQVGAAQGLWTHSPTDWAGNEPPGTARPAGWPNNAKDGYLGIGTGTRPGGAVTQDGPAGSPIITAVSVGTITTTTAIVSFSITPAPTSCRVNYGTTQAVASNTAGTATAGAQNVSLSTLTTQTTYYFSVQATNASGTAVTHLLTFRTA